jgi:hypothetical protein
MENQINQIIKRLNIKLTAAHKEALLKLSIAEGECMSVVIRNLIKESAIKHGLWDKYPAETKEVQTFKK